MQAGHSRYATMGCRGYGSGARPPVGIAATAPGGGVAALGRGAA